MGQHRQAKRAAAGKQVQHPRRIADDGRDSLLQHGLGILCRLKEGAGRRRDGKIAKPQEWRCRRKQRQRRGPVVADRKARDTGIDRPAGKLFATPVMPACRAPKQKADAVIKAVCLCIDGNAKREMPRRKVGKLAKQREQVGSQHTAIPGGDDTVRPALKKSGGNAVGKPFQVKTGPATAAAR
ncbi:MAG: hypothetical protein ACPG7P_07540 [Candidatus Puniceispirillaceae bacterium]